VPPPPAGTPTGEFGAVAAGPPEPAEPPLGHLPHRRRGEYLSAELRGGRRSAGTPVSAPDPERARRLVTSFRAGFQQGLPHDAERIDDATHR
jgi:hypothetical protein